MHDKLELFNVQFLVFYFNDILLYRKSKDEHIKHLRLMLIVLRGNKLFANLMKYIFLAIIVFRTGLLYCDSIMVDDVKVKAIRERPTPLVVTKL